MPQISIIVPVYQVEPYLRHCVDSILAQTYPDFELILVDDGSPDNCPAICDAYAAQDSRIKVIHKRNGGVCVARNAGLDVALGEYITFVDSDDYLAFDRLSVLFHTMESSNADVVISNYTIVSEDGKFIRTTEHREPDQIDINHPEIRKQYIYQHIFSHGWEVWTRLFRRNIIQKHAIRFSTSCGNYAEDLGFVLAYMFYANRVVSTECAGYFYRLRSGSMMRRNEGNVKLNSLNEVSKWLYPYYCAKFHDKKNFAVLHFLLMHTEYHKMIYDREHYSKLSHFLETIQDRNWFYCQTANIRSCRKELDTFFGKRVRKQIGLFSHYCMHRNWKRYSIESAIAYKWFIGRS